MGMMNQYGAAIISSLILFVLGWLLAASLKRVILRIASRTPDQGIITFLASLVSIGVRVVTIVMILDQFSVNSNVIVGAFSACALGISMALKSTMSDVAGGVQILLTKPFVLNDYISLEDQEGTVKRIDLMFTELENMDGLTICVPNSKVVGQTLVNYTKKGIRRIHIVLPLGMDSDYETVKAGFLEVIQQSSKVLKDHPMEVSVDGFEQHAVKFGVYCYCLSEDYLNTYYLLTEKLHKKRIAMGIPCPSDSIQLHAIS